MNNIEIVRVYHDKKLLEEYPFVEDGIRTYYNTENVKWGKYLCEFCYILEDTLQLNADFIGVEHYRRTFSLLTPSTKDFYLDKLEKDKCYIFEAHRHPIYRNTNYLEVEDYTKFIPQLCDYFKMHNMDTKLLTNSDLLIWRGLFIMHQENFKEYRKFMKDLIIYLFQINNIVTEEDMNNIVKDIHGRRYLTPRRTFAYIIEFVTDIWIRVKLKGYLPLRLVK